MNKIEIEQSKNSPYINFDPNSGTFTIIGESRPENVRLFYEPLLEWMHKYTDEIGSGVSNATKELIMYIRLGYFNSSSAKYIFDLLHQYHQIEKHGIKTRLEWQYDEGDEDMKQAGLDLSEMLDFQFDYNEKKQ